MKGNSTHMPLSPDILKDWTVLVVDDEPDSAEIVQALLEVYGAHVLTAANGRDGLEMIRRHRPRFVITDLTMPEMSGWEAIERLKDDRNVSHIPIIVLSALTDSASQTRAFEAGANSYLMKPFRFYDLKRRIDDLLELSAAV